MTEPDVVLTDWALTIECAVFARQIGWSGDLARSFGCIFAAIALATLAGGTAHGFHATWDVLWPLAVLALGVAALGAWAAGAHLGPRPAAARRVVRAAAVAFGLYAVAVVAGEQRFFLPILNYCAASAYLLWRLAGRFVRTHEPGAPIAIAGLGGIFAGAVMQQEQVAWPRAHLDHNALFHVVQGVALALLFAGARNILRRDPCSLDDASS
jgi:hypothetical protein